jgi:hypothetical protein
MKERKPVPPVGPRVFIVGLKFCEIVYLPETGQIVSRLPALKRSRGEDRKIATVSQSWDEEEAE